MVQKQSSMISSSAGKKPAPDRWSLDLEGMPDFDRSMERIYAWYDGEIIDRPPVRFVAHNAAFDVETGHSGMTQEQLRAQWFDEEYQVETYLKSIEGKRFHGETFPVFSPNLGPNVYAAFYGVEMLYDEVTSWMEPVIQTWDDMTKLQFSKENVYLRKIEDLTRCALEQCEGKFMVGYTDLHPGVDCALAWRGSGELCIDMVLEPNRVRELFQLAVNDFEVIFDHFDDMLKAAGQLSVSWMGVPSFKKLHLPSGDFTALISPAYFNEFCLPILQREMAHVDHNVYHVDGPGVANHLDTILAQPEVTAIQWVQGVAEDRPILQWVPLIKKVQDAGVSIIVDLQPHELAPFMDVVDPEGIYIWVSIDDEEGQLDVIKRLEKWTAAGK